MERCGNRSPFLQAFSFWSAHMPVYHSWIQLRRTTKNLFLPADMMPRIWMHQAHQYIGACWEEIRAQQDKAHVLVCSCLAVCSRSHIWLDTGLCCPSNGQCCATGCGPANVVCCPDDKYCPAGFECCGDGTCVPTGGQCCGDGTSCDAGNVCVKIAGRSNDVCCTDTLCKAYVSNGKTMTYDVFPTIATNPMTTQATLASAQATAFQTSAGTAAGGGLLTTYTFTVTW